MAARIQEAQMTAALMPEIQTPEMRAPEMQVPEMRIPETKTVRAEAHRIQTGRQRPGTASRQYRCTQQRQLSHLHVRQVQGSANRPTAGGKKAKIKNSTADSAVKR